MAVEIFLHPIANGALVLVEKEIEGIHVVGDKRLLVPLERRAHLGDDLRQVDVHGLTFYRAGSVAATVLLSSRACATRSATSSRHGAAMICTPTGSGESGTGTATTGRPTKEIGCVKMPMLGRSATAAPSSCIVC